MRMLKGRSIRVFAGLILVTALGLALGALWQTPVKAAGESAAETAGNNIAGAAANPLVPLAVDTASGAIDLLDPRATTVLVSNVHAQQFGSFVWITYDLAVTPAGPVPVSVMASNDGGLSYTIAATTVYGAVGTAVQPGVGKIVAWNLYQDRPGEQIAEAAIRIDTVPPAGGGAVPESNLFATDTRLATLDANSDGTPDDLSDYDQNGVTDVAQDFNGDGIPDGFADANGNGEPDAYQDLNNNGIWDGFEDANNDGIPDWFQARLPLYSPTHPDPAKWYFSPAVTIDYTNYTASVPLNGYLWVADQTEGTIVTPGGTFRAVTDPKTVQFTPAHSGTWYFHIAQVGTDTLIIPGSQLNLRVNVYVDGFVVSSDSHPDPDTPSLKKTFTGTVWPTLDARTWERVTAAAGWSARSGHQTVVFNGRIYVLGGFDVYTGGYRNDVWSSADGKTWVQETASAGWSPRDGHQAVVLNGKIYVLGGHDKYYRNDVWSSRDGKNWVRETYGAGWSDRDDHHAVVFKGRIYVLGGYYRSSGGYSYYDNDVWSSADGKTWVRETASAGWSGRYGHQAVVFNDRIFVLGGNSRGSYYNDVWSSADGGKTWVQETASAGWSGRLSHQAVVFNDRIFVLGGYSSGSYRNDVWSSADGKIWVQDTDATNWSPRWSHQAVVFNNKIFVLGGYSNDVWSTRPMLPGTLQGYRYRRDTSPDTVPGIADPFSASSDITIPGIAPGTYWFHVSGVDAAGRLSAPTHYKFIVADAPPNVASPTHPDPDIPGSGALVTLNWNPAGVPDVVKYKYAWGMDQNATPNIETTARTVGFPCVTPGVYWFIIESIDKWGYVSPVAKRKVTVGGATAGPAVSSTTQPNPATAYPLRDVTLNWTPAAGSGPPYAYAWDTSPYTTTTTASTTDTTLSFLNVPLGRRFLHIRAVDGCGNPTDLTHFAVRIREARAPVVTIVPTSNKSNIGFTWTDPDSFATGTPKFFLIFDQNPSTVVTPATPFSTNNYVWTEFGKPDGLYYFHIRSEDDHGNLSAQADYTVVVGSALVGLSAPSETVTQSGPVKYTVTYPGATSVSLTAAKVSLIKTGTADGTVAIQATADPLVKNVVISNTTGDGTLAISIAPGTAAYPDSVSAPAVGPSGAFTVDNTPPTLAITGPVPGSTAHGPVVFTLAYEGATDILLRPQDVTLVSTPANAVSGAFALAGTGNSRTVTVTNLTGEGQLHIVVAPGTASDAGDIYANGATSAAVVVDAVPPVGGVVINGGAAWTNSVSVSLGLTYGDGNGSGVTKMRLSNDGTNWSGWENVATNKSWTLAGNAGTQTVYVQFRDAAGNESLPASDTIMLDTSAPTGSVVVNSGAAFTDDVNVSLALTYNDVGGSGVKDMRFSNNGTTWSAWEATGASKAWALSAGDGTKTVHAQFRDLAGNVSQAVSDDIVLDAAAPTGTMAINGGAAWTKVADVTLGLAFDDSAGSGVVNMRFSNNGSAWTAWESAGTSKTWSLPGADGSKTVYAQFRDNAGNISSPVSDSIGLDTSSPTGAMVINNGAPWTSTANVSLGLTFNDGAGSGVAEARFSDNGTTWTPWEAAAATTAWTLSGTDGAKTVFAQFRDSAGNESTNLSDGISLDTNAPTGSVVINGGAAWTKDVNVSLALTYNDVGGSGVKDMRFSNDGTTWSEWRPAAATKAWTIPSAEGGHTVYAQFSDLAGNVSQAMSDDIALDTTPPTASMAINDGAAWTNMADVMLSLTYDDGAGSGVAEMLFSNDRATWSAREPVAATKAWALLEGDGTKTVYARFLDNAGNYSDLVSDNIGLDTGAPTGTMVINNGAPWTSSSDVSLDLTFDDGAGSDAVQARFKDDVGTWGNWVPASASIAWALPAGDGTKTVFAQFRDSAGNETVNLSDDIGLDTSAPTGSVVINSGAAFTKDVNVSLALIYDDGAGSGVKDMCFSNDGTIWSEWETAAATASWTLATGDGPKTVYVQFRDTVGNTSPAVSDDIAVDTTPPAGAVVINNGAAWTNVVDVTLGLTYGDAAGSGVAEMQFSGNGSDWSDWRPVAAMKNWQIPAVQGEHRVYAQFRDAVGNVSAPVSDTISFDATAPGVTLSTANATVYGPFVVNAAFTEVVTGFDAGDVSVVNGAVSEFAKAGQAYQWKVTPAAEGVVQVSVPIGVCVDQAGNQNDASNILSITYSLTPPQVAVPDVRGRTQSQAAAAITTAGLLVGGVTQQNSATVPAGQVMSQNPAAGTLVARGTPVSIVISLGPQKVAVPDVRGKTQAEAEAAIAAAGLTFGGATEENSETVAKGSVISQAPAAGTQVDPGTAVSVVVSLGPVGGGGIGCAPGKAEGPQSAGGDGVILALVIGGLLAGGRFSRKRNIRSNQQ